MCLVTNVCAPCWLLLTLITPVCTARPCKERMMDVVAEEHRQGRRFSSFEELELASFEELRGVLEQAGVADWLPAAVGFQPTAVANGGV